VPTTDPASATLPVDLVNLPFLGARTDTHALFQYLLAGGNGDTVDFSIPGWVALREHLTIGAGVTFHLPFRARADFFDEGEVVAVRADSEQGGQVATARLTGRSPLRYPVYAEPATGAVVFRGTDGEPADPVELTRALLRDCALAKSGVRVYFKHLVPLFSRITLTPSKEYAQLRAFLLEEIRGKIEVNVAAFTSWGAAVAGDNFSASDLLTALDLEAMRAAVEPEINNELFDSVFDREATAQYLDAIRLLERRLCLNYNTLVLLYAAALRG
jgi:hypothetical protein